MTNENLKKLKLDFTSRNGIIVPFMSLPIDKDAINQITVSSTLESETAMSGLNDLKAQKGYEFNIVKSKIPIRF